MAVIGKNVSASAIEIINFITMNEAIKLAIEKGGYKYQGDGFWSLPHESYLQDPLFWQALGKALGWWREATDELREHWAIAHNRCGNEAILRNNHWYCEQCEMYQWNSEFDKFWLVKAHEYLDLVLTGGDTEQFWKELLKQP